MSLEWMHRIRRLLSANGEKEEHRQTNVAQYNRELKEANAEIDKWEYLSDEEAIGEVRSWRE